MNKNVLFENGWTETKDGWIAKDCDMKPVSLDTAMEMHSMFSAWTDAAIADGGGREHITNGSSCWCGASKEDGVVIHNREDIH